MIQAFPPSCANPFVVDSCAVCVHLQTVYICTHTPAGYNVSNTLYIETRAKIRLHKSISIRPLEALLNGDRIISLKWNFKRETLSYTISFSLCLSLYSFSTPVFPLLDIELTRAGRLFAQALFFHAHFISPIVSLNVEKKKYARFPALKRAFSERTEKGILYIYIASNDYDGRFFSIDLELMTRCFEAFTTVCHTLYYLLSRPTTSLVQF